ncbi:MAG: glutamate-5-semialdehyde dehydrogenase [Candidatus Omnitrophica bacterium]|nr:glutamate-5-semialdehyde dehydrogenase [Candidatus Omnitrophota bacterium]
MKIKQYVINMEKKAKAASWVLPSVPTETKNRILLALADSLLKNRTKLFRANRKDLAQAQRQGLSQAFLDRLLLDEKRIDAMAQSLENIARLADPVGQVIKSYRRPNGLLIKKVRVPIGVIAIIYEARPNVTSDCIGLCLKSGNAVILRGGKEALNSNLAVFNILSQVIKKYHLPEGAINLIRHSQRKAIDILLSQQNYIDLVIPRGGEGLIRLVSKKSQIPVIKHYKGICHVYVDQAADLSLARKVVFNAKVQRPGVCNAMETLLVHRAVAKRFLPEMIRKLQAAAVEIRGCPQARRIVKTLKKASAQDWSREYLDLILSVKVVPSLKQAIEHINRYGSRHSDAIISQDRLRQKEFLDGVDSACVYVNASTRFTDGYEFGLGAEMGISTDKIHCRGPMALEELTTYKYKIFGKGQIRT